MRVTLFTEYFRSYHRHAQIFLSTHALNINRIPETWPAGPGIKFFFGVNNAFPQHKQWYVPVVFVLRYSPLKGDSVPLFLHISYCSGVSFFPQCWSLKVFLTGIKLNDFFVSSSRRVLNNLLSKHEFD